MDGASEPQRIFLRCGSNERKTYFGDELRQGFLEHLKGREGPARAGQSRRTYTGRKPRLPGSPWSDELDVADVRSADETFLCDRTRAMRHLFDGTADRKSTRLNSSHANI